ncbi:MAG: CinA family protein, partial [Candidatus Baltobacteraceae bacterium]
GIVAYADDVKRDLLGVDAELLRAHGAVSEEVARAMARGVRERLRVDLALATTGIAGPSGATENKPVGLVYLALASPEGVEVRRVTFPGTRDDVRRRTVVASLNLLWRRLERPSPQPAPAGS